MASSFFFVLDQPEIGVRPLVLNTKESLPDVATAGVPKAGVFAEGAARIVAQHLVAQIQGGVEPGRHLGQGTCYIEFGEGRIGSVDIDFLSGPEKTGHFNPPSAEQMALKEAFGATRRARWFGRT